MGSGLVCRVLVSPGPWNPPSASRWRERDVIGLDKKGGGRCGSTSPFLAVAGVEVWTLLMEVDTALTYFLPAL